METRESIDGLTFQEIGERIRETLEGGIEHSKRATAGLVKLNYQLDEWLLGPQVKA
jgi:hypothetical protein